MDDNTYISPQTKSCSMDRSSFDNVKGQVGHCGLWCGSCIVGNGLLAEMTSRYERVVCGHGVHKWVLKEKGDEFVQALETIKNVDGCPGCLKGGGDDTCPMRDCTKQRGLVHCDECGAGDGCLHAKRIEYMRSAGKAAGMVSAPSGKERDRLLDEDGNPYFGEYPGIFLKKGKE
jgi:hypothetical protein